MVKATSSAARYACGHLAVLERAKEAARIGGAETGRVSKSGIPAFRRGPANERFDLNGVERLNSNVRWRHCRRNLVGMRERKRRQA